MAADKKQMTLHVRPKPNPQPHRLRQNTVREGSQRKKTSHCQCAFGKRGHHSHRARSPLSCHNRLWSPCRGSGKKRQDILVAGRGRETNDARNRTEREHGYSVDIWVRKVTRLGIAYTPLIDHLSTNFCGFGRKMLLRIPIREWRGERPHF